MENIPSPQSFIFSDDYICQWDSCLKNFDDAEMLYEHVRDDHVGRKAHHNLCLTCRWDKCTVPTFAKRDHITSHLRVHIASKPFACEICKKGFKRPQDLKKHEKTHQDNPASAATINNPNAHLQPGNREQTYQPLTPPSYLDRSPSIASSTISAHSPYNMPMSPASMADSTESWSNPGLASPSHSTNSDLYNSPRVSDLGMDLTNNQDFSRPTIDVSGTYYGVFPPAPSNFEDMISPMSAKRSRDGYDELLSDTLGSFAMEAKKKRMDPSYNEDMMGRLNALSAILEVNPLTPDRLISSLPNVNDWNQFNQLNQFCSTLFEDVSGEVFEPQTFDTLFPDYDQKQTPISTDAGFGVNGFQNYNTAAINPNLGNNNSIGNNLGFSAAPQGESIYSTVIPDDPFVTAPTTQPMAYGTEPMPWDIDATPGVQLPGVVRTAPVKATVQQQVNPFDTRYYTLGSSMSGRVKPEVKVEVKEEVFEPKVVVKTERTYADMSTQTKAKQEKYLSEGGQMMMQRPAEKKKSKSSYEGMDPALLMLSAPSVPDTPLPELATDEIAAEDSENGQENTTVEVTEGADTTVSSNTQPASSSRFGGYVQKGLAKQAAAAAAAAAAATTTSTEPLDPLEAMTRQLAQARLEDAPIKTIRKPSTTKPITDGGMERQIKAAKARAACSEDPVRKQHAEVVLNLLKSIDALMTDHRQKVAMWKEAQAKQQQLGAVPRVGSSTHMYPRTGVNVQNQGQIRTVSSYLPRRTPHQASPLHQEHNRSDPDYSQLRSSLTEEKPSAYSSDSPVLYPTSNLHEASEVPFELSEEERRFIEEDIAKTPVESAYPTVHVLQAVKSGVESLRSVLANNPMEHSRDSTAQGFGQDLETQEISSTSPTRSRSGSWSFLPTSLSGKHLQNLSSSSASSYSNSGSFVSPTSQQLRAGSIKDVAESITDSVAESIKSLSSGLKLGQLAEGFGLNGPVPGVSTRRGTGDQYQQNTGPYLNSMRGQASRSRVWMWNGQDVSGDRGAATPTEMQGSDGESITRMRTDSRRDLIKTGAKTEEAAKETAALLAKVREQEDVAMERARRMPEVEKMAQRYQDSWTEIHDHTARNSEKADSADVILEKVIELCMRHAKSSMQLAEEAKDLKDLDESLDEMVSMSENIQKKLVGLEAMIEKLENEAEVSSLAEWKKTKTAELDKYMESKRKELWDKAELLSTRSEQFQKEEAARKLRLYQNQFETDMERFRRTQEERNQDLWRIAEAEAGIVTMESPLDRIGLSNKADPATGVLSNVSGTNSKIPLTVVDLMAGHPAVLNEQEEEERREKEDLDNFLGPATESDSKEEDEDEDEEEEEEEERDVLGDEDIDEDDDEDSEEDEEDEDEEDDSEDDLDPIAKARKSRAQAAAAAARLNQSKSNTIGSTISAFSALSSHPSTTSLSRP
ncbi:hypothetical protein BGZ79_001201 [Entomortierella chlamydospora]|nr:hypothetical protein BGZ79_001201 [Entomortierella chlamydospora]